MVSHFFSASFVAIQHFNQFLLSIFFKLSNKDRACFGEKKDGERQEKGKGKDKKGVIMKERKEERRWRKRGGAQSPAVLNT